MRQDTMRFAERMNHLGTETAFEVLARARALEAKGRDIVHLEIGEPDFDTPDHIKEAAIQAIREGFTKYTPVSGIDELKEAVSFRFKEDLGLDYKMEEIMISCGGKHVLYNIAQALWGPGDEVIVPANTYIASWLAVSYAGARPVPVEPDPRTYNLDPERIETAITGDGADAVAELFEVLPVFLRDLERQPKSTPTKIEFQSAGKVGRSAESQLFLGLKANPARTETL